ncbi:MAG: hypothetical protein KatS3mg115_2607 [Candidatus Poribacteria bacterium]|nr:MAG: hypothetical protein KatS3mg115_2607 [Candidatus Poribacteria bacterium]
MDEKRPEKKLTILQAAERVLREAGEPLHVDEIARRIIEGGLWRGESKTPQWSVAGSVYASMKHDESSPFVKVKPGIIGLREWIEEPPSGQETTPPPEPAPQEAPSDALVAAIQEVRERIQRDREQINTEAQTIASLIYPLLEALDWDPSNPSRVRFEDAALAGKKVDCALLVRGRPRVFIEAKVLGGALDDKAVAQLIGYCATENVDWGVLTNGEEWRIYWRKIGEKAPDQLLWRVELASDAPAAEVAGRLGLLRRDSVLNGELDRKARGEYVSREVKKALQTLFTDEGGGQKYLVSKIRQLAGKTITPSEIKAVLKELRPGLLKLLEGPAE